MFAYRPKAMEFIFYAILILLLHAVNFFTLLKVIAGGEHQKKGGRKHKKNLLAFLKTRKCLCEMSCKASLLLVWYKSQFTFFREEKKNLLSFQFLYSTMTTVMEHEEEENDEKKIKIKSHKDY